MAHVRLCHLAAIGSNLTVNAARPLAPNQPFDGVHEPRPRRSQRPVGLGSMGNSPWMSGRPAWSLWKQGGQDLREGMHRQVQARCGRPGRGSGGGRPALGHPQDVDLHLAEAGFAASAGDPGGRCTSRGDPSPQARCCVGDGCEPPGNPSKGLVTRRLRRSLKGRPHDSPGTRFWVCLHGREPAHVPEAVGSFRRLPCLAA